MNNFQFAEASRLDQGTVQTQGDPILSRPSRSFPSPSTHASSSCTQPCSSTLPSPTLPPFRKRGNIADALNLQAKEVADESMCNFLFALGLPFHIARSFYYKDVFEKVREAGPSYVLPSKTTLRTTLFDRQYAKCTSMMDKMRADWVTNGCSIVMDGWTDIRQRPLINIIVTGSEGPFLRAIDCSGKKKDAEFQFVFLKNAIEEVGPSNVVQVNTFKFLIIIKKNCFKF